MKVRWSRDGSEAPVLCYQRGEEVTEAQHEDYRHRAQLPEAELSRGNVSLLLSSTRVTDQGTYTCSVSTQSRSQQAAVQLQLTDSSFSVEVPVALVSACVGDTVTLPCRLSPLSSAVLMEVRWFREGVKAPVYFYTLQKAMTSVQSEEYRDRTRLFMEELRNGNLSLQLDNTQTSDSGLYKCSVSYNLKEAEAFVELKVAASVQNEKQTLNEGCESCKKLASVQTDKELANNVDVTLHPDPANRSLKVSKSRLITFTGEGSAEWPSVRGSEGFTSGRHYWEVKVEGKSYWALGVSSHPDEKIIPEKPEEGYWLLRLGGGKYEAVSQSIVTITLPGKKKLEKVGVCLDYDEKKIAFYNVVNANYRFHIHSIEGGLSGQVYPIFSPGSHDGDPLIIVGVKHHNK
ncbi:UNVERIFIED_CONTAM: hypothetical protein FKN15_048822 [Acipenser sinensis]